LIIVQLGKDLIDKFVLSTESKLYEGILQLLGINDTTEITIEDIECSLDISNFFDWDGKRSIVLSSEWLFLGGFAWLGWGFGLAWFSDHFAHNLKISKTN
jgi:hypothetical protein